MLYVLWLWTIILQLLLLMVWAKICCCRERKIYRATVIKDAVRTRATVVKDAVRKRNVNTQSQYTYALKRSQPRFVPLAERSHGAFDGWGRLL